jgi:hypothetical protein
MSASSIPALTVLAEPGETQGFAQQGCLTERISLTAPVPDQPAGVAILLPSEVLDALAIRMSQLVTASQPDGRSPWMTVVEAARRAGYECRNGRAPGTIYNLVKQIGRKVGNKWLVHVDDFDQAIREGRV